MTTSSCPINLGSIEVREIMARSMKLLGVCRSGMGLGAIFSIGICIYAVRNTVNPADEDRFGLPIVTSESGAFLNMGQGTDSLTGTSGSDVLWGHKNGGGELYGGGGNDLLVSGQTADVFDGGSGFDTVSYQTAKRHVSTSTSTKTPTPGTSVGPSRIV